MARVAIAGAACAAALLLPATGCSATAAAPDHGGVDASTDATLASDGGVDGGLEAGVDVPTCLGSADCMTGQICCAYFTTMMTGCQAGPCPSTGSVQICATAADCFVAGDTCDQSDPCSPGLPIRNCNGPGYTVSCGLPAIDAGPDAPGAPGDAAIDAGTGDAAADGSDDIATDAAADASAQGAGEAGGPCTANSDCPTGDWCLFLVGDCSAQGQCRSPGSLGSLCNIVVSYCGCNGAQVGGLCGEPYAFGPTLGPYGGSECERDASAE
jgi:hypothetical protein